MKLGLFTDPHYCSAEVICDTRRPSLSLGKIREAMEAFRSADVDACICLGDLTDHAPGDTKEDVVSCFHEALGLIRSYNVPFYLVPGNHDYLMMTGEELTLAGIRVPPYAFTIGEYRFIVLDANYRSSGQRFDVAGVQWTDSNLPEAQCQFLENELKIANGDCIVCIHENLDPLVDELHKVKNAERIRDIIRESGKVKLVLQGHYHPGAEHTVDSIPYVTVPAMCEGTDNAYQILTLK